MVIDCHCHFTTVPKALPQWRERQLHSDTPTFNEPVQISDDELRASLDGGQLAEQRAPGLDVTLLTKVVPLDNILFGSEMIGAVKGIDPETGHNNEDDTKRYVESAELDAASRKKLYAGNVLRVYPRLKTHLQTRIQEG